MSPWFFNIFFFRVLVEMNKKGIRKKGKVRSEIEREGKLKKYYMQMIQCQC